MKGHGFWQSGAGELLLILLTFGLAVVLTVVIANVSLLIEAGLLFPVLLAIIFVLLSSLFRHRLY